MTSTSDDLTIQESMMALGLYMYGGMYTSLNGSVTDNVHIDFVSGQTGEVIRTADSKDLGKTSEEPAA